MSVFGSLLAARAQSRVLRSFDPRLVSPCLRPARSSSSLLSSTIMPSLLRRKVATAVQAIVEPVGNGKQKRTARAIHSQPADIDIVQPPPPPTIERRRSSRKSSEVANGKVTASIKAEEADDDAEAEESVNGRKRRRAPTAQKTSTSASNVTNKSTATNGRAKKAARVKKEEPSSDYEGEEEKPAKAKGKRAKKPKEPVVYVIPDVPHRDFRLEGPMDKRDERAQGFRGRLGYACLNTVLRGQDPPVFCSRNVRIKTIEEKGLDWVKELAVQNVRDIIPLLEFNAANNIHLMRLSSEIFPFASHEVYGYDIAFAAKELAEAGAAAKRLNQRLTMHPGQFCQLGTPKESVLEASLRELDVHAKVLDLMGVGPEGVMILHGGGTFGDREATLSRIRHTIDNRLSPSVRSRLVLENDELGYSAEELLPLCESLNPPVPLVFDFHHDMLRPSSLSPAEIVARAQAIFARRGVPPKYHLSEPRKGAATNRERRAHSDRCMELPPDLPADADLMLECKDKEQGVLEMFRIYQLFDVNRDVLRPPANDVTMATSGRRSKLDGSGGSTHPSKQRKKGAAKTGSGSDAEGEAASESDDESKKSPSKSPKKARVTEASLMERAIAKAKEVAAMRGVEYKGPRSQEEVDTEREGLQSSEQVKRDMERQADWIRNELRQGRERRAFPGSADAQAEQMNPESQVEPEPNAY